MKKYFSAGLTFVAVVLGILIAGCGVGDEVTGGESEPEESTERIEQEVTELPFKKITLEETPERIQKWVEENQSTEQKKVFIVDGKTYVIVLLGEKPTGGYGVEITQIADNGGGVISVAHKVTEPEEGGMVTQVITYPLAIAEMDGEMDKSFQFTTSLKPEELDERNDPDESASHNVESKTQKTSGGAKVELNSCTKLILERDVFSNL